jgi:hypothetical protein
MEWQEIEDIAAQVIKAHPGLTQAQYAKMLQHQFQDQPVLGWLLLEQLSVKPQDKPHEEPNG